MQIENSAKIRNIAVAGHNDTGKTTLASALLFASGVTNRLHRVEDGNTLTDFDPEEIARTISIGLSTCFAPWQGHKINLLDCPGYGIFFNETQAGMQAADSLLLCVNSVSGIEVTTERVWRTAEEMNLPVIVNLTKMDRERADFDQAIDVLQEGFDRKILPLHLPIGSEENFRGVVDLVTQKAMTFDLDGEGQGKSIDIPDDIAEDVELWRSQLIEAVAESDDDLMERFFEEETLTDEEFESGLRNAIAERKIFPVTLSAMAHGIGPSALLDALVHYAPDPLARGTYPATTIGGDPSELEVSEDGSVAAVLFKTLSDPFTGKVSILRVVSGVLESDSPAWNSREEQSERLGHLLHLQGKTGSQVDRLVAGDIGGVAKLKSSHTGDTLCAKDRPVMLAFPEPPEASISFAIEPKSKGDDEKIGEALHRLREEDPTLGAGRDAQTGEYLLSGTGQLHVEIAVAKLKTRFKVEVILHPPKVPYRETILRGADGHGRHKKQTGGRGQFADCKIRMEVLPRGGDFEFVDKIFGGSIPQGFRPAVEKGIQEARLRGYLAGYPVLDFKVELLDGQYHDVDSSEMAFKIAGSLAFKDAMSRAGATILEPYMQVDITTTEEYMGDIMSDLSQRRGRPQGMEAIGSSQVVRASVPMSEMLNYAPSLRSMTQGRASFHMEFSHYEAVPKMIQEKIIAEAKRAKEEE